MKPNQYYIDNIKLFVNEYFPGTPHVLLTGSFNTPFFNESSDLDIILNLQLASGFFRGVL